MGASRIKSKPRSGAGTLNPSAARSESRVILTATSIALLVTSGEPPVEQLLLAASF